MATSKDSRTTEWPDCWVARLPSGQIAEWSDCRVAGLLSGRIAEWPNGPPLGNPATGQSGHSLIWPLGNPATQRCPTQHLRAGRCHNHPSAEEAIAAQIEDSAMPNTTFFGGPNLTIVGWPKQQLPLGSKSQIEDSFRWFNFDAR